MTKNNQQRFVLFDPKGGLIHEAFLHPEYSDHFVTLCGMVVTIGESRRETNHTRFQIRSSTTELTCEDCAKSK